MCNYERVKKISPNCDHDCDECMWNTDCDEDEE